MHFLVTHWVKKTLVYSNPLLVSYHYTIAASNTLAHKTKWVLIRDGTDMLIFQKDAWPLYTMTWVLIVKMRKPFYICLWRYILIHHMLYIYHNYSPHPERQTWQLLPQYHLCFLHLSLPSQPSGQWTHDWTHLLWRWTLPHDEEWLALKQTSVFSSTPSLHWSQGR